jgi:23S rRNA (uracil1939-C5)-methyltransferase
MADEAGRATATLVITGLDQEARGVGRDAQGKVWFVDGALPGETVRAAARRSKKQWVQAQAIDLQRESSQRVAPRCPHFGVCGGCSMQHLEPAAQVAVKQRVLEDALAHLGRVRAERIERPLYGTPWGYRQRARLSVRLVPKKGGVLVGFRERRSSYVADLRSCAVLPPKVSMLLLPLRALVGGLSRPDRIAQIEVAVGDRVTALALRHLEPLTPADLALLRAFAAEHEVEWWLQPKGPDSLARLDGAASDLAYRLPESGMRMHYRPTDFTQVNAEVNRLLVERALRWLAPRPGERVVDWFCGLGNFTLPLARRVGTGGAVLGIEGSRALVERAAANAALHGLAAACRFECADLFGFQPADLQRVGAADAWLIDPPREGALALAKAVATVVSPLADPAAASQSGADRSAAAAVALADASDEVERGASDDVAGQLDAEPDADLPACPPEAGAPAPGAERLDETQAAALRALLPRRIVYVSCNPATLARDAGLLVHRGGYRLVQAAVVNMFPHTSHVESIALFVRAAGQGHHATTQA